MQVQASRLQRGDRILGLGSVAEVRIYGQQVAVTGPTDMPWPTDRKGNKVKGALMNALLAEMASVDCYRWVASSVVVKVGRVIRHFLMTDLIEIVGESQVLAKAA